ncbi:hypothetical protein MSIMFI_05582 [Mycobacterium simulans]|nr:hypothetical protein MSIMFI_05582 [Mycobacterium simulans]
MQQGTPDLPHRSIERQGMTLAPHLPARWQQAAIQRREQLSDIAMGNSHPLRNTGRARGVEDVGQIVGGRIHPLFTRIAVPPNSIDNNHRQTGSLEAPSQIRRRHRSHRASILNHNVNPGI